MKIYNYFNKSLSRQVLSLLGICLLFFIIGIGFLFYFQHKMHEEYIQQREKIEDKQQIVNYIYSQFNSYILVMPDSIAVRVPKDREETLNLESELRQQMTDLDQLIETEEERSSYQVIDNFTIYYFKEVFPLIMNNYEKNHDPSADLTNKDLYYKVEEFTEQTKSLSTLLEEELTNNSIKLTKEQSFLQNSVITFFILFLILLLFTIQRIIKNVGKPLADFTFSVNEIAAGRDAAIKVDENRKDELGTLSVAFQKMVNSIQDKEQDLLAHNEELIAQQEELQAQQTELQVTLEMLTENEQNLIRRNELINGISTSLDKAEVLQSIVESMCKVIRANKGLITFLNEDTFASFGVSKYGVEQFRHNLNSGLNQRLVAYKKAFTVKREQSAPEKGFHETLNYSYDLYLPVLSALQEVNAIMVFSRYDEPFSEEEQVEYETLARQISISLEKIKLYEQSEENRRLNQDILNTVQEGIQLIDQEGKIIQANQQLIKIFKSCDSIEEMIGLSRDKWIKIMAEKVQEDDFIELLEGVIEAATSDPDEEHSFIYRMNESNQVIQVYCLMLQDNDGNIGTLLVHRDITKEYEMARMKSEFVSTVSHELRTPLASVLGFTELLLTRELKPERKTKYLQTIYNEATRLTALINDFLDIQRMESGKQTYEKKFIDITSILQNVIKLQEVNTSMHSIDLSVELMDTIILGDRIKIEQVFTNLLSNAIKYSPNGGNILIRVYGNDDIVSIDIKDEGLGIPEDAIPDLFQQFYRVDNSDRRRIGGTGLGLAIVQEIVKAHGGVISVSSEYGKGSIFTTNFPRVMMRVNKQNEDETASMLKYTIMVVEDDLSLAELLNHELQDCGFHVSSHNSGKKALEQMKTAPPDAIVLDIMLEDDIDGWTIMKEMKASEELKDIPIFVSTALDEKEYGFSLGAQDYLVKPYKPNQLSKLIMHTLLSDERNGQIMLPQQSN